MDILSFSKKTKQYKWKVTRCFSVSHWSMVYFAKLLLWSPELQHPTSLTWSVKRSNSLPMVHSCHWWHGTLSYEKKSESVEELDILSKNPPPQHHHHHHHHHQHHHHHHHHHPPPPHHHHHHHHVHFHFNFHFRITLILDFEVFLQTTFHPSKKVGSKWRRAHGRNPAGAGRRWSFTW